MGYESVYLEKEDILKRYFQSDNALIGAHQGNFKERAGIG